MTSEGLSVRYIRVYDLHSDEWSNRIDVSRAGTLSPEGDAQVVEMAYGLSPDEAVARITKHISIKRDKAKLIVDKVVDSNPSHCVLAWRDPSDTAA